MHVVLVAMLRVELSGNAGLAEHGLRALGNLAMTDDSRKLLGVGGACEGE